MPLSLWQALDPVRYPRRRHGGRYPLLACLGLVVPGLLTGRQSLQAILELHEHFGDGLPRTRGCPPPSPRLGHLPAPATYRPTPA